jgi:putative membrane protein
MTFLNKIQVVRWSQSPFDRRWKMAQLSIDTAASGPADHKIAVEMLDADFAKRECQALALKLDSAG